MPVASSPNKRGRAIGVIRSFSNNVLSSLSQRAPMQRMLFPEHEEEDEELVSARSRDAEAAEKREQLKFGQNRSAWLAGYAMILVAIALLVTLLALSSTGRFPAPESGMRTEAGIGWLGLISAALLFGSLGVFAKIPSVIESNIHPVVFHLYQSSGILFVSLVVLIFQLVGSPKNGTVQRVSFTWWGVLAAFCMSGAQAFAVVGVRGLGNAMGPATWAVTGIFVSFVWGVVAFQEPIKSAGGCISALLLLSIGILGVALSPTDSPHRLATCICRDPRYVAEAKAAGAEERGREKLLSPQHSMHFGYNTGATANISASANIADAVDDTVTILRYSLNSITKSMSKHNTSSSKGQRSSGSSFSSSSSSSSRGVAVQVVESSVRASAVYMPRFVSRRRGLLYAVVVGVLDGSLMASYSAFESQLELELEFELNRSVVVIVPVHNTTQNRSSSGGSSSSSSSSGMSHEGSSSSSNRNKEARWHLPVQSTAAPHHSHNHSSSTHSSSSHSSSSHSSSSHSSNHSEFFNTGLAQIPIHKSINTAATPTPAAAQEQDQEQEQVFLVSLGVGVLMVVPVMIVLYVVLCNSGRIPPLKFKEGALAGFGTGLLWGVGNVGMVYATRYLGMSLAFPLAQACIVVSGFWGMVFFTESRGWLNKLMYLVSTSAIIAASALLLSQSTICTAAASGT